MFIYLLVFGEEISPGYLLFALGGGAVALIYPFEHRDIRVKSNFESESELRRCDVHLGRRTALPTPLQTLPEARDEETSHLTLSTEI